MKALRVIYHLTTDGYCVSHASAVAKSNMTEELLLSVQLRDKLFQELVLVGICGTDERVT